MQFISLHWLRKELPVVYQHISSISYGFGDKCYRKEPTKVNPKIWTCKRYHFIGYWWIIQTFWYLILKRGLKGTYLHIWKEYLTHETIRQDKCPKYNGSSILLCQKHYCVQQVTVKENIVSTLAFNIHLFNFPMSTCCSHHASHCVAL